VFSGKRHPNDDALVRRYLADRGLDALQPKDERVVRHLDACEPCARRYAEACAQLDAAARLASEAADAAFGPERLLAQRDRVLRRLDGVGSRVVSFPTQEQNGWTPSRSRSFVKWVAVAAAAGLFIGLSVGRILNLGGGGAAAPSSAPTMAAVRPLPASGPQATPASLTSARSDDVFLSEVETALSARSIPELAAIDAMTLELREPPSSTAKN
jgi:hypothetical protein